MRNCGTRLGCVLEAGIREAKGSAWQFLSSAVLAAFAFEAYLNHVGSRTITCWSGLERLSPWSKFELLCETLSVQFQEGIGARPLQTVDKLLKFRNTIAHGRSVELVLEQGERRADANLDSYLGQRLLADWEQLVQTSDFARRAREDVQAVLSQLHEALRDEKEHLFTFGPSSSSAKLVERP